MLSPVVRPYVRPSSQKWLKSDCNFHHTVTPSLLDFAGVI